MSRNKRKLVAEDLYRFVLAGDPQISPDGAEVAFVRSHVDPDTKESISHLWVVPAAGGPPRILTRGSKSDTQPRWSPDGKRLAFVRRPAPDPADEPDQRAEGQIWIIERDGGEAWPLTAMRHGAANPTWSPDGRFLAFTSAVGADEAPEEAARPKSEADRRAEKERARNQARVIRRFEYKHDLVGLYPERWIHVWVAAVPERPPAAGSSEAAGLQPVPVTAGPYDHALQDWSPDSRWLAVACSREDERLPVRDIWLFPVPGAAAPGTEPVRLTDGTGFFTSAVWSPVGDRLAVVGHHREYHFATLDRLWLYPAPGHPGKRRCLTADWDRGLGGKVNSDLRPGGFGASPVFWSPDGRRLYFTATDRGTAHVFRVKTRGGPVEPVTGGEREVYGLSVDAAGKTAALAVSTFEDPGNVVLLDLESGRERPLTDLNADLRAALLWPERQEIVFAGYGGRPIHGWILKPVGFRPGERYPAVLQIHGGPHTCYGHSFYLEFQLQAALGYVVIFTNPRGSSGYGQEFERACQADYGGADMEDLLAAVNHAIGLGLVDPERLAVTGGSYGGFMTNWIVGRTDRFRAAIAHRSISNWVSMAGVSDIGPRFVESEFQVASPWEAVEELWERSPLRNVQQIVTPLLICHSENDLRCPMEQAEQLYAALKWHGKETELVRHPRSTHELTRSGPPMLRVDRFRHIARWLLRYVPVREAQYAAPAGDPVG